MMLLMVMLLMMMLMMMMMMMLMMTMSTQLAISCSLMGRVTPSLEKFMDFGAELGFTL